MTNLEKLKQDIVVMSAKELAALVWNSDDRNRILFFEDKYCHSVDDCLDPNISCQDCFERWLEDEVKE